MTKKSKITPAGLVFMVIWGVLTGVLWAYVNPITLVPGVIHLRIFAFLPAVIGIFFGPISGFASGYIGSLVWSLLSGAFIPAHTLLVDGIMVGFTGWLPAIMVGKGRTLEEIATDKSLVWKSVLWCGLSGIAMIIAVSLSLSILGIFDFRWALFWLGLSDVPPLMIGTPIIVKMFIKRLSRIDVSNISA
ncbi:aminotriazole resistance protein [Moorella sp. E306M]|uniref:aminotriazole resistance protein n=1 Tax=Moorella sp. E306M TaxID=2572683 RepID=UPI0010FFC2F5|nr:aminotriazole resistance protein [Moorella sp. E306M]GEA18022.1 hypothetical protein E306M_11580 [Moorella sp. E306M]